MSEIPTIFPEIPENNQPSPEEIDAAVAKAAEYLKKQVPVLSRLTGLDVHVGIGKGWATNLKTGDFTVDPSFFTERGYTPDHCAFATLHELLAHVRDVVREPEFAERQWRFTESNKEERKARRIFVTILTDILGNKKIMYMLPDMREICASLYENRLFAVEDNEYVADSMHLQFLYKIIRQEMIPGSETLVRPEVDKHIEELRNFQIKSSKVDLIKRLTDPAAQISGSDRFDLWLKYFWPRYKELLEQDEQEAKQQSQNASESSGDNSENSNESAASDAREPQSGEQQEQSESSRDNSANSSSQSPNEQTGSDADGEDSENSENSENSDNDNSSGSPFEKEYADYFDNKHPEPFGPEEHEKIEEAIKKAAQEKRNENATPEQRERERQREANEAYKRETDHSLKEKAHYNSEVRRLSNQIDEMRKVFQSVLREIVANRRGLSRHAYQDGDVLDPNRLPQTYIDVKGGNIKPEAYQRYEDRRGRTELTCNTDYFFVFDRSGSMAGARAKAAAECAIIMMEALASMEREIRRTEHEQNVDLSDLSIRTSLLTFSDGVTTHKPLSPKLTDKERLDTYSAIQNPNGWTSDFLALQQIANLPRDHDRQRIIIVVTDGVSSNPSLAEETIYDLRRDENTVVFGVSIGSTEAEALYAPNAKLVKNPKELPDVLRSFVEKTLQA